MMNGLDELRKLGCWWRYGRRLSAYLDRELNADAVRATAGHLSNCESCRIELEQLRFASRALVEFETPFMRAPIVAGNVFRMPQPREVSFFKRLCSQKLTVPLPLALALLGIAVSAFIWTGASGQPAMAVPAAPDVVVEIVRVPVDRVVTRTVYVKQPSSQRTQLSERKKRHSISANSSESLAHNNSGSGWADALKDFRPAANANLRVIKEQEE